MNKSDNSIVASGDITPCTEYPPLASKMGLKRLFLKREDLHPYKSHKGRSIPHMIDTYIEQGHKNFVISSSGNAALAASMYINEIGGEEPLNMTLDIFIGQNANKNKIEKLESYENDVIRIIQKERPLQALILAEQDGMTSLRQSTNDLALLGYESLAKEIVGTLKSANQDGTAKGSVFVGTSSGTTAQALAQYMIDNKLNIQIHIVQTSSCHPISDSFEISDIRDESSIADAIVDQTAHRKSKLVPLIKKTGGKGWIVSNEEIISAQKLVATNAQLDISTNGVLGIAGAIQAVFSGQEINEPVVCIVCGE
jgi:threonine synthase